MLEPLKKSRLSDTCNLTYIKVVLTSEMESTTSEVVDDTQVVGQIDPCDRPRLVSSAHLKYKDAWAIGYQVGKIRRRSGLIINKWSSQTDQVLGYKASI